MRVFCRGEFEAVRSYVGHKISMDLGQLCIHLPHTVGIFRIQFAAAGFARAWIALSRASCVADVGAAGLAPTSLPAGPSARLGTGFARNAAPMIAAIRQKRIRSLVRSSFIKRILCKSPVEV